MPAISLRTGIVSTDRLAASKAAIVEGWYPGISGSAALAKSLFGKSNKCGKAAEHGKATRYRLATHVFASR